MENADQVTHKTYRESLQNNQDLIRQSIELATVHLEVPLEFDLNALKARDPDRQKAYKLFQEMEFNTLTKEFCGFRTAICRTGRQGRFRRAISLQVDQKQG